MFIWIFLTTVLLTVSIDFYLTKRQVLCVAAHRDTVPVEFIEQVSPEAHQKAADYTTAKSQLSLVCLVLNTALVIAFTLLGGLNTLNSFLLTHTNGLLYGITLIASTGLIYTIIELPLDYYRQFKIEKKFGFSRMALPLFFIDYFKSLLVCAVIGAPLLALVLAIMTIAGQFWWLYTWGIWVIFNTLLVLKYPIWIAPLFNHFTPLEHGETHRCIKDLLKRCDFPTDNLLVMDNSRRSSHSNAYFTGLGKNRQVVFFDTLLKKLNPQQIEAILAHELGHFKKHHTIKNLMLNFGFTLGALFTLSELAKTTWFFTELGVFPNLTNNNHALALVLFFLIMPYFNFLLKPILAAFTRKNEYEADAFAAKHSNPELLISALVKLHEGNATTLTPDPWRSLFFDSQPPASMRIARLRAF